METNDLRDGFTHDNDSNIVLQTGAVITWMKYNSLDSVVSLVWVVHTDVILPGIHTPVTNVKVIQGVAWAAIEQHYRGKIYYYTTPYIVSNDIFLLCHQVASTTHVTELFTGQ